MKFVSSEPIDYVINLGVVSSFMVCELICVILTCYKFELIKLFFFQNN